VSRILFHVFVALGTMVASSHVGRMLGIMSMTCDSLGEQRLVKLVGPASDGCLAGLPTSRQ